jgi:hypothetical protein
LEMCVFEQLVQFLEQFAQFFEPLVAVAKL